jgi:hypothetical protein
MHFPELHFHSSLRFHFLQYAVFHFLRTDDVKTMAEQYSGTEGIPARNAERLRGMDAQALRCLIELSA